MAGWGEKYVLLLYVTMDQEIFIRKLFESKRWDFMKIDANAFKNGDAQKSLINDGSSTHCFHGPGTHSSTFEKNPRVFKLMNSSVERNNQENTVVGTPDVSNENLIQKKSHQMPESEREQDEAVNDLSNECDNMADIEPDGRLTDILKDESVDSWLTNALGNTKETMREIEDDSVDYTKKDNELDLDLDNNDTRESDIEVKAQVDLDPKDKNELDVNTKKCSRQEVKKKMEKILEMRKKRGKTRVVNGISGQEELKPSLDHSEDKKPKPKGKKKTIFCSDCKTTFTSQKRFDGHKEKNGGKCVFECEYCGKVFLYRKSKYLLHVRSAHTKERPFVCDVCGKGYVTSDKLKIHMRVHTGEKTCICEECGLSFYSRGELFIHKEYHHVSREQRGDVYCEECGINFCSKRYLIYHKTVTHSDLREFSCSKCGKCFKTNSSLQRHLRNTHVDSRDYKCELCGKSFKNAVDLKRHTLRHGAEKTFVCLQCNKAFFEKSKLQQHMRIHTGEKPYKCNLCSYKTSVSGNLTKHRKTHFKML